MRDRKRTIIVDLDGTLADLAHREHHVRGKKKNWPKFFEGMNLDPINVWCRELIVAMQTQGYRIAIVSGRPDSYASVIREWLKTHDVQYDALHLRREGDYRSDDIVKREILHEHFKKEDILFVVDDRERVVKMWREEGLVCLQCAPGDFDTANERPVRHSNDADTLNSDDR